MAKPQIHNLITNIDNGGGLPYNPGDFLEVSSPYHTVKLVYDDDDDKIVWKPFVGPLRKVKFLVLKQYQAENQNEL